MYLEVGLGMVERFGAHSASECGKPDESCAAKPLGVSTEALLVDIPYDPPVASLVVSQIDVAKLREMLQARHVIFCYSLVSANDKAVGVGCPCCELESKYVSSHMPCVRRTHH